MLGSIAEQCIRSDQVEFSDRCDSIGCGIFSRNQRKFPYFLKRNKKSLFSIFLKFFYGRLVISCVIITISLDYKQFLSTLAINSTIILSNKCSSVCIPLQDIPKFPLEMF